MVEDAEVRELIWDKSSPAKGKPVGVLLNDDDKDNILHLEVYISSCCDESIVYIKQGLKLGDFKAN